MANGDILENDTLARTMGRRRPLRDHGNAHDWLKIWQALRVQFPSFDYEVTMDERGRVQVVTMNHPTKNGRRVSRRELVAYAQGRLVIAFDPPGTPDYRPPRHRQRFAVCGSTYALS